MRVVTLFHQEVPQELPQWTDSCGKPIDPSRTGWATQTCPLCEQEAEMPFCKTPKGQRIWWQCPNPNCGCGFYTDNHRRPCVGNKELEAWRRGAEGWA